MAKNGSKNQQKIEVRTNLESVTPFLGNVTMIDVRSSGVPIIILRNTKAVGKFKKIRKLNKFG